MAGGELTNQSAKLVVWNVVITFLTTFFLGWRLIERYKLNPRLWLSDYLMIVAWILETVANVTVIIAAYSGYGRMDNDPFLTSERRIYAVRYMFYSQALCVYSVFLAKLSICAFLMVLNFSKGFRYIIWTSFIVTVIFNGIWGTINTIGYCWPIAARWDPNVVGKCWPLTEKLWSIYTQSAANIFIDLVYAVSPLIYIRQIRVSRRTRWGIQLIFFLALFGTGISIAKIIILGHDMVIKKNTLYMAVDGSILAGAEFGITLIVGCLPPLRKSFERMFKRVLPENFGEFLEKHPSFVLPYFSTRGTQATGSTEESHGTFFYEEEESNRSGTLETPPMVVPTRGASSSFIG
ncbi:hypothetical protein N431DRAFT_346979 [Stipitochalara longipes BDJ]|nr:hypothetical protein N431DRAFT_346979 [Stipitochalara longipes BDJ]